MTKPLLARRELERLLRASGFSVARQRGSHNVWQGLICGSKTSVVVDQKIDSFAPDSFNPLYFIVMAQLRFFVPWLGSATAWERFYAGEQRIARRAGVQYRRWDDPYWCGRYSPPN